MRLQRWAIFSTNCPEPQHFNANIHVIVW
ncbi:hypothetical protein Golax_006381 [Gossypium laxum]|uniref:Uncharacterized protein n=1 Tax=Gossypium laxum TaxID=34288 RepID=A0A7J9A3N0_9ROSI|nr:hypothetical protein [Gossypium laxum]